MEREIKSFICLSGIFFSTSLFAMSLYDGWTFRPNVGLDVGVQKQAFETGFGEEHFREHYPQTNLYVGARIHEYFGVEVGYEHMYPLQKRQYYYGPEGQTTLVLGSNLFEVNLINGELYFSQVWQHGWHASLVGLWPVCKDRTFITVSVGVARMKSHYETVFVAPVLGSTQPVDLQSDERYIGRFSIGLRQMVTHNFGLRVQGIWEDTHKLEATAPLIFGFAGAEFPTQATDNYTVLPKDSYIVNVGFFWEFL